MQGKVKPLTLRTLEPGVERTFDVTLQSSGLDDVEGIHRFFRERRLSLLCPRGRQVAQEGMAQDDGYVQLGKREGCGDHRAQLHGSER